MKVFFLLGMVSFVIGNSSLYAQDNLETDGKIINLPARFLSVIDKKASQLENKVVGTSEKTLKKLEKQEERLKRKLIKKDSLRAEQLFGNISERYTRLRGEVAPQNNPLNSNPEYLPYFDTLKTSLSFLSSHANLLSAQPFQIKQLQSTSKQVQDLENQFEQSEKIRRYMQERQQQLKQQLQNSGMVREYRKLSKDVYYYTEQIKEYKAILQDPRKVEQKAISLLQKLPAYEKFIKENSQLASLFRLPEGYGSIASLQGLQTRSDVMAIINQRIQSGGPNAQAMVQQGMQQAQAQMQQLKNKINQGGARDGTGEMPDFKPNNQKTKSFLKRLEYGTNIQSVKANSYFPTTSDIGLSVGYKLNDRSVFGIGASYKVGWGKDIRHISITHEGVGLRSFIDWRIKGSFFVSGGYEQNYRERFDNVQQLRNQQQNWQQSALIGISKKYRINKKVKGNTQLMYDFLHQRQVPRTQPVVFRLGYQFR